MAEQLSHEQRVQLAQLTEPLRAIEHQIWLLGHPVDRTIIEHIRSQLTASLQRIGSAVVGLTGEDPLEGTPHVIDIAGLESIPAGPHPLDEPAVIVH